MANQNQGQNQTVAVEANLSQVRDYLSQQGYNCVNLDSGNASGQGVSAIVISGADKNVMGIQDVTCNAPVINADGMTPQDIAQRLQQTPQQS